MQTSADLLISHWTDQYQHVQSLDESLDITLNRSILARSKSWQISRHRIERINIGTFKVPPIQTSTDLLTLHWMDKYWHVQSLVNANFYRFLGITLNGQILICSKSRQCKLLQISWHRIEWTNIATFKVLSTQISWHHIERTNIATFKVLSTQISWHHIERTNISMFKVLSMQIS